MTNGADHPGPWALEHDTYRPVMTTAGWALEVARDDLASTTLLEVEVPEPADGEAVLRVDRVGLTANNVT